MTVLKALASDGHYFVPRSRCALRTLAVGTGRWASRATRGPAKGEQRRSCKASCKLFRRPWTLGVKPKMAEGALPTSESIRDDVQISISQNSFEDIMEAVRQEKHYQGITAEDVMRCLPKLKAVVSTRTSQAGCLAGTVSTKMTPRRSSSTMAGK